MLAKKMLLRRLATGPLNPVQGAPMRGLQVQCIAYHDFSWDCQGPAANALAEEVHDQYQRQPSTDSMAAFRSAFESQLQALMDADGSAKLRPAGFIAVP